MRRPSLLLEKVLVVLKLLWNIPVGWYPAAYGVREECLLDSARAAILSLSSSSSVGVSVRTRRVRARAVGLLGLASGVLVGSDRIVAIGHRRIENA